MATHDDLMTAIRDRDATRTAAVIAESPELLAARPASGASPLLMAIYMGAADCVTVIRGHVTCDLREASALDDLDAMEAALRADPTTIDDRSADGWTALHLAAFLGRTRAARWLFAHGASVDVASTGPEANRPLHAALAGACSAELVALLLEHGADVRATGAADITPLHIAASRGSDALVDLLVARGADPQAAMADGRVPADLAQERGFPALADRLRTMR